MHLIVSLMRVWSAIAACLGVLAGASVSAVAAECPGNPDALGTSRVISVDPTEHRRIGTLQYHESLPLADKEVVLTFDDGPLPPYTAQILETLVAECVKATFFMVGRQARAYPDVVRRVYNEGHTVASHSQNHHSYSRGCRYRPRRARSSKARRRLRLRSARNGRLRRSSVFPDSAARTPSRITSPRAAS
jgi:hypothetical protein